MSREQTFIHTKTGKTVTIAKETLKYILPSEMKLLKPYESEIKTYPPEYLSRRLQSKNETNVKDGRSGGIDNAIKGIGEDFKQSGEGKDNISTRIPKKRGRQSNQKNG